MSASPLLLQVAQPAGAVVVEEPPPLITGETTFLVAGVIAAFVIFVLLMVLLARWRVSRRAAGFQGPAEFFQPAGEGAEITFDEMEAKAAETLAAPSAADELVVPDVEPLPAPEKKKPGFSIGRMFAKKEKPAPEPAVEAPIIEAADAGLATVRIERPERSVFSPSAFGHEGEAAPRVPDWASIEREDRARIEREEAEAAARLREEEAEAEQRRLQAEEHERRRLDDERRRLAEQEAQARIDAFEARHIQAAPVERRQAAYGEPAHDDIVRTLSEVEEALHAQREAIQAETRALLDSFARRFSDRLDALAQSVERRGPQRLAEGGAGVRPDAGDVVELVGRRLDEHREQVTQSLNALSRRLDAAGDPAGLRDEIHHLRRSLANRGDAAAPLVQLSDIVRDALPPTAYEFNCQIANNRRADCLIKLPHPPGPIAVDARFPVEAFHDLHAARHDGESEFKRVALRHIVDIAERLIVPGVTSDSAMMFVPSESMYSEIHARFPEVVQDSYRARVWIVSPTTLMATLHTLSAVTRDAAGARGLSFSAHGEAQRALAELDRLRDRVETLERAFERERGRPLDKLAAKDAERRAEAPSGEDGVVRSFFRASEKEPGIPSGDLYAEEQGAVSPPETEAARPARPPFPLR